MRPHFKRITQDFTLNRRDPAGSQPNQLPAPNPLLFAQDTDDRCQIVLELPADS
jgi:hypothetical protein